MSQLVNLAERVQDFTYTEIIATQQIPRDIAMRLAKSAADAYLRNIESNLKALGVSPEDEIERSLR